jgi:hypothetical protein
MGKKLLLLTTAAMLLAFNLVSIRAQTKPSDDKDTPRFEIGGHLYSLGWTNSAVTDAGAGGRFTYNLNRYLAIDTELNASLNVGDESIGFNGTQFFTGLKAGKRSGRFGIFAKARPGLVANFHRATGPTFFDQERVTKPALDLGAIVEYYPNKHTVVRFDVSDVIIAFGDDLIEEGRCPCPHRLGTRNNLQIGIGFGVRF